jgi:hypothetical protein
MEEGVMFVTTFVVVFEAFGELMVVMLMEEFSWWECS